MKILGQIKASFIDYPGHSATVVFTGGCNFACGYCHNPSIVKGEEEEIPKAELYEFLHKRKRFLDGVCITGGEPTLHEGLYEFIKEIKAMGYKVKLDTNGTNPIMLEKLIDEKLIDYVAMDIKGPFHKYQSIVKKTIDTEHIAKSIDLLMLSKIDYEFRTTVHKEILSKNDLMEIAKNIKGSKKYCIQNFKRTHDILNPDESYTSFEKTELEEIKKEIENLVEEVVIR